MIPYCKWGYIRYNLTNKRQIYGLDIFAAKSIDEIKIGADMNQLLQITNHSTLQKWLMQNKQKQMYWLGINYRNNKVDFCIYYRNNTTLYQDRSVIEFKIQKVKQYYNSNPTIKYLQDPEFYGKDFWHTKLKFKYKKKQIDETEMLLQIANINKKDITVDWGCGLEFIVENNIRSLSMFILWY